MFIFCTDHETDNIKRLSDFIYSSEHLKSLHRTLHLKCQVQTKPNFRVNPQIVHVM